MALRSKPTLERLGVSGALREALVARLEELASNLSEDAYQAALAGAAAADDVHRIAEESYQRTARDYQEIQRLLGAFSGEMKKLDEALRVLSAYVQKMRTRTQSQQRPDTLH
jgi:hypothetical protein